MVHHRGSDHRAGRPRCAQAAIVGALLIGVTACGSSSPSKSGSGASDSKVVVAVPPVISGIDVYVAQKEGFFAQHHITVSVKSINGGASIVPAMESGAVDVGETNVLSAAQGAEHGLKEPCFAGANTDPTTGYRAIVSAPKLGASARSLTGQTIAVNGGVAGVNQLLAEAYLRAEGVNPTDAHYVSLENNAMPGALEAGRIGGAVVSEPFTTISTGDGAHVLTKDPLSYIKGNPVYSCWNASSSWLSSHHSTAFGFVAAMKQADQWITSHQAAFRTLAGKYIPIPKKVLQTMQLPIFTTAMTQQDVTDWEMAAKQYKLLTSTPSMSGVFVDLTGG